MAHGYFKIEGKPLAVLAHGTVGPAARVDGDLQRVVRPRAGVPAARQHARRDDAAPGVEVGAQRAGRRRTGARLHKWDDTPMSLQHFGESAMRAYKVAMTPPYGPVVLIADSELQERPIEGHTAPRVPQLTLAAPPQAESGAVAEVPSSSSPPRILS
jgi:acetolactate synthase-1/2/3 large subunit